MCKFKFFVASVILAALATTSFADDHSGSWILDPALSNVSFGSIKNDYVGESHSFSDVTGTVGPDGKVNITIALASMETSIDIRNERIAEFVFKNAPSALIAANLDMTEFAALEVGKATTIETSGTLSLLGTDTELDGSFFVMRLSDDRVLVTTNGMLMLSTEDAELDAGIDKLQELASLDSITRVSPVTMRLVFDADM